MKNFVKGDIVKYSPPTEMEKFPIQNEHGKMLKRNAAYKITKTYFDKHFRFIWLENFDVPFNQAHFVLHKG